MLPAKKGQMFTSEAIISILSITVLLSFLVIFLYTNNLGKLESEIVKQDAERIHRSLMQPGYPINWNDSSVERIGLADDGIHLNDSKIGFFSNVSYSKAKKLLQVESDFLVYFEKNGVIQNLSVLDDKSYIGKPDYNISNIQEKDNPKNLHRVETVVRFPFGTYYDQLKMVVLTWRK